MGIQEDKRACTRRLSKAFVSSSFEVCVYSLGELISGLLPHYRLSFVLNCVP